MPVFVSCHFFGNESQVQKVMLMGCDWCISILACFACRKTMLGDAFRTIAAMQVTLKAGVNIKDMCRKKLLSWSVRSDGG